MFPWFFHFVCTSRRYCWRGCPIATCSKEITCNSDADEKEDPENSTYNSTNGPSWQTSSGAGRRGIVIVIATLVTTLVAIPDAGVPEALAEVPWVRTLLDVVVNGSMVNEPLVPEVMVAWVAETLSARLKMTDDDIATTPLEALEAPKHVKRGQKGGNIPKRIAALLQWDLH